LIGRRNVYADIGSDESITVQEKEENTVEQKKDTGYSWTQKILIVGRLAIAAAGRIYIYIKTGGARGGLNDSSPAADSMEKRVKITKNAVNRNSFNRPSLLSEPVSSIFRECLSSEVDMRNVGFGSGMFISALDDLSYRKNIYGIINHCSINIENFEGIRERVKEKLAEVAEDELSTSDEIQLVQVCTEDLLRSYRSRKEEVKLNISCKVENNINIYKNGYTADSVQLYESLVTKQRELIKDIDVMSAVSNKSLINILRLFWEYKIQKFDIIIQNPRTFGLTKELLIQRKIEIFGKLYRLEFFLIL
jgi:hypothetical protein